VVLAGAGSRRLGGRDKALIDIGGATLIDRVVAAVDHAGRTVIVGPRRPVEREVIWTQEQPEGSGPVAALIAGLGHTTRAVVVVLAVDLPHVTTETVVALLAARDGYEAAVLLDEDGHPQPLAGAYQAVPLRAALQRALESGRMLDVLDHLDVAGLSDPTAAVDCDDWDAVELARARFQRDGSFHTSTTTS
jgi:molybdopterin-guanine dinucleotide biosynthesis protein A